MSDASKPGRVLARGLLAGTVMFAIGAVFHWLVPILAPWIAALFAPPVFRPWPGWTRTYMIVHPFWFGLTFAWLFTVPRAADANDSRGCSLRGRVFLIGALPVYLLCFASIAIPRPVIVCWLLQGLTQYVLAGAALGLRRVRAVRTTPIRRSRRASTWNMSEVPRPGRPPPASPGREVVCRPDVSSINDPLSRLAVRAGKRTL